MTEETKIEYPATHVAHWATGPVNCCARHAGEIVALSNLMGFHTAVTIPAAPGSTCKNCDNESDGK